MFLPFFYGDTGDDANAQCIGAELLKRHVNPHLLLSIPPKASVSSLKTGIFKKAKAGAFRHRLSLMILFFAKLGSLPLSHNEVVVNRSIAKQFFMGAHFRDTALV